MLKLFSLEWNTKGIFERIVGKCTPDFHSQSNVSTCNVNSRQREIQIFNPLPVEQSIKKGYFLIITLT